MKRSLPYTGSGLSRGEPESLRFMRTPIVIYGMGSQTYLEAYVQRLNRIADVFAPLLELMIGAPETEGLGKAC
jgi:hypothetical protein